MSETVIFTSSINSLANASSAFSPASINPAKVLNIFGGKNLLLPKRILSLSWIKVIMHGDMTGYLGGARHSQSGAPSFKLKIVFCPQEEQNWLAAFQFTRIEALDMSLKLDGSINESVVLKSVNSIFAGSRKIPRMFELGSISIE